MSGPPPSPRDGDRSGKQSVRYKRHPTNIFNPLADGPPKLVKKFFGVETNFENVVDQGEYRGERESRHEQRDEAILENHFEIFEK